MFETTLTLPRTSVLTEPLGSVPSTSTAAVQTTKRRRRRRNKRRRKSSMSSTEVPSSRTYDPVMTGTSIRGGSSGPGTARRGRHRGVSSASAAAAAAAAAGASSSAMSGGSSPALYVDPHDYFETLD